VAVKQFQSPQPCGVYLTIVQGQLLQQMDK